MNHQDVNQLRSLIVLVGGGLCAGKKEVCKAVEERISHLGKQRNPKVRTIHMNDYIIPDHDPKYNDHPRRFDIARLKKDLDELSVLNIEAGALDFSKTATYDESRHNLSNYVDTHHPNWPHVILIEGYYALYDEDLRKLSSMMIFVDSDADIRLCRLVEQKADPSGSNLAEVLDDYFTHSRVEMSNFILGTKEHADVVLPRGAEPMGVKLVSVGLFNRLNQEVMSIIEGEPVEKQEQLRIQSKWDLREEHLDQTRYVDLT
ncbi:Uridine-cytidine kinase 2 [Yarrowia sp. C11]|nr:Uridine-cytidine kinase 2 [Yarrowia sp. C11]